MKKLMKTIFSRMALIVVLLLVQIAFLFYLMRYLSENYFYVSLVLNAITFIVVIIILNRRGQLVFKMAWVVPIVAFSFVGGIFYLILQFQTLFRRHEQQYEDILMETSPFLQQDATLLHRAESTDLRTANTIRYVNRWAGFPAHDHTQTSYLPLGDHLWPRMLEELERAERYIFLEYFIIERGKMWDSILEVLCRKAQEGVEVRVLYDGMGCISTLPGKYHKTLAEMGINCRVFNPFVPFLSGYQNNRDHRKICVIDGLVAFTGGNNLADEYVNEIERFGHWRDNAIMLRGGAAYSFAVMFLQMWRMMDDTPVDYATYRPQPELVSQIPNDGFVMPYGDCPIDEETVGAFVYLDIINNATRYLYITTPYLILNEELISSLSLCAKRGVDVRILVPEIPDKWYTHAVAGTFFEELIENQIKIYKYIPGFIHSKSFVCDDTIGVIGSINLDYRSLYLHYECGCWMYQSSAVGALRDDFLSLMQHDAHEVTLAECRDVPLWRRALGSLLRLFAPLM